MIGNTSPFVLKPVVSFALVAQRLVEEHARKCRPSQGRPWQRSSKSQKNVKRHGNDTTSIAGAFAVTQGVYLCALHQAMCGRLP